MGNTKETLLNTAEKLFAEKGFHNTSIRELTSEANVNISAINYHFGSKDKLFEAIITRRLLPINKKRMERLSGIMDKAEKESCQPDARELITAFFEPIWLLMVKDDNAKYFLMIIGTIFQDSDTSLRNKFINIMKPVALSFFEQICKALPKLPHNEVYIRVQLAMGAFFHGLRIMFHPSHDAELQKMHLLMLPDKEEYYRQIIDFITKGITE